ncbi:MAG TPA: DivIVA domain-containing protein [Acidimicrobiales bacterium]|nr:DivIVA domain-containing protein [Acidimicrobiales bacterium]
MDVSPKTLREVEFREKMRGYHPEDVDQFLEQVAAGLEVLQDRLRQAVDRAQRAESAAAEAGGTDEILRKTLVLAQRTADLAVQEAREQAARILAGAEQQAQSLIGEAEDRARRAHDESVADMRAELGRLETVRQQAQGEVELIRRWVDDHRQTLTASLRDSLGMLEGAQVSSPPPVSRPIDLPPAPRANAGLSSVPMSGEAEDHPTGPETVAWRRGDDRDSGTGDPLTSPRRRPPAGPAGQHQGPAGPVGQHQGPSGLPSRGDAGVRPDPGRVDPGRPEQPPRGDTRHSDASSRPESLAPPEAAARAETATRAEGMGREAPEGRDRAIRAVEEGPNEQALDDFFDDEHFTDERRFGGRLRRRR